ncbi:hypothetical protein IW256_004550 [Actinomadura viridis]|uniref:Uncharacterized protein n=1 Tax=Actinomadura viridis TaxID=58110 RepID=A0A931GKK1_9ACTN|nr:hypothetical protein [Actinomadura viridis]MBG6090437.1 hypothetical protein [Actinomadura viridis]
MQHPGLDLRGEESQGNAAECAEASEDRGFAEQEVAHLARGGSVEAEQGEIAAALCDGERESR